jgi:hypothetical protein
VSILRLIREQVGRLLHKSALWLHPLRSLPLNERIFWRETMNLSESGASGVRQLASGIAVLDQKEIDLVSRKLARARIATFTTVLLFSLFMLVTLTAAKNDARTTILGTTLFGGAIASTLLSASVWNASGGESVFVIAATGLVAFASGAAPLQKTAIYAIVLIPVFLFVGHYLNLSCCAIPYDTVRTRIAFYLSSAMIIFLGLADHGPTRWAAIAMAAWLWGVVPFQQRALLRDLSVPGIAILAVARTRWRRQVLARAGAIILAAVPILLIVNSYYLKDRLEFDEPTVTQKVDAGSTTQDSTLWLYSEFGRLVDEQDFRSQNIYALDSSAIDVRRSYMRQEAEALIAPSGTFKDLPDSRRLRSSAEFMSYATSVNAAQVGDTLVLWRFVGGDGKQPDELLKTVFVGISKRHLRNVIRIFTITKYASIALLIFGILVFWRASDRGPAALSVGVWAFGYSCAIQLLMRDPYSGQPLQLRAFQSRLARHAFESAFDKWAVLMHLALSDFASLLGITAIVGILSIPVAVYWVWRKPSGIRDARPFGMASRAARLLLLGVLMVFVSRGEQVLADHPKWFRWSVALTPVLASFIGLAIHIVRDKCGKLCAGARWFHWLVFLLPGVLAMVSLESEALWDKYLWLTTLLVGTLTVGLVASILYLIVIRNEWNLAGGETFATIATIVLVPLVLHAFGSRFVESLVAVSLFPPESKFLVEVLLVVLILEPVRDRLSEIVQHFANKTYRGFVSSIPELVQNMIQQPGNQERSLYLAERAITPLGEEYALYMLGADIEPGHRVYHLLQGRSYTSSIPKDISVTNGLYDRLANERRVLRSNDMIGHADYSCYLPEIWKLIQRFPPARVNEEFPDQQMSTTPPTLSDFIMPINTGDVVCGLLLCTNELGHKLEHDDLHSCMQTLGIIATTAPPLRMRNLPQ